MKSIKHIIFIIVFALSSTALIAGGIKTSTANDRLDRSDFGKACNSDSAVQTASKHHVFGSPYHYDVWGTDCHYYDRLGVKHNTEGSIFHKTGVYYKDILFLYINEDGGIRIKPR